MFFTYWADNMDARYAGKRFHAAWGEFDQGHGWQPAPGGETLLVRDTPEQPGWTPQFDWQEFGAVTHEEEDERHACGELDWLALHCGDEELEGMPEELWAHMRAIDASVDAMWGHGGLEWDVTRKVWGDVRWRVVGRSNLTEFTLEYPR